MSDHSNIDVWYASVFCNQTQADDTRVFYVYFDQMQTQLGSPPKARREIEQGKEGGSICVHGGGAAERFFLSKNE